MPSTISGRGHVQHGSTPKSHKSVLSRPGFKFNEAPVPQVCRTVCIYFAFYVYMYNQ